jgi:hypothetical protein
MRYHAITTENGGDLTHNLKVVGSNVPGVDLGIIRSPMVAPPENGPQIDHRNSRERMLTGVHKVTLAQVLGTTSCKSLRPLTDRPSYPGYSMVTHPTT